MAGNADAEHDDTGQPDCNEARDDTQRRMGPERKVAIVTGGGAANDGIGNGRAPAILLARAGAKVLVVDRDLTRAERTVSMIAGERGNAVAASYDVTSSAQCAAMVADAVS